MLLKIDDRRPHPFRFMGLLESISPSALYELKVKNCFVGIPNNPSLLVLPSCCSYRSFTGTTWWVQSAEDGGRYEARLGKVWSNYEVITLSCVAITVLLQHFPSSSGVGAVLTDMSTPHRSNC